MKIAIFYHVFQNEFSAFVYQAQMHRLYASGLISAADYLHIGVNGKDSLFNGPKNANVVYNKNTEEETDTLNHLKEFATNNLDHKILYLHTKGVSKRTIVASSWRLMMEYFVIDKWKDCIKELDHYDCVGHSFIPLGPTLWEDGNITENKNLGCYPGNFWWANASYITTLNHDYLKSTYRFDREFWIGSNPNARAKSMINNYHYEPYSQYYKEEEYV